MAHELDIEPEPAVAGEQMALMQALPDDFPLAHLLQFLPDVRLKQHVEQLADQALAIDVVDAASIAAADTAREQVRLAVADVEERFKYPCDIANKLHKRLTGLRADFVARGRVALDEVGQRIILERRRLERAAQEAQRRAQEEADRQVREASRHEAELAAAANAPAPVVEALRQQSEVATAPPVRSPVQVPPLRSSTQTSRWKARVDGTPADSEPNPSTSDMTPEQQAMVMLLVRAVAAGQQPLACLDVNWPVLNARAQAEKTTMLVPGIEAYEVGGLRSRGRR